MLKIIIAIFFIYNISYACLTVSSSPTTQCSKKAEFIDVDIDAGELDVGTTNNVYELPIYINTNSHKSISMKMDPVKAVKKNKTDSIGIVNSTFTSIITGNIESIKKHKKVELLPAGYSDSTDGATLIGYITFTFSDISELQTAGNYVVNSKLKVYDGSKSSSKGKIKINFSIKPILVVGLNDVSSYRDDKIFKYANIDFGNLNYDTTTQIQSDVYVKTNYNNTAVYMRFNNTPELQHNNANETIGVNYFYKHNYQFSFEQINSGSEFLLSFFGKKDGSNSVGILKFVADESQGKLSGEYSAIISVTISAQ